MSWTLYQSHLDSISPESLTEKCVILDLDETLVSTQEDLSDLTRLKILSDPKLMSLRPRIYVLEMNDVITPTGTGKTDMMWGIVRPHVMEFLIFCFSYFKIVAIWSAGQNKYVDVIVNHLFKDLKPPHVIFSMDDIGSKITKPIVEMIAKVTNLKDYMSLENTLVIDDRIDNFSANPKNGILIPGYRPEPNIDQLKAEDQALLQIKTWLLLDEVKNSSDVRTLDKTNIFILTPNKPTLKSPRGISSRFQVIETKS